MLRVSLFLLLFIVSGETTYMYSQTRNTVKMDVSSYRNKVPGSDLGGYGRNLALTRGKAVNVGYLKRKQLQDRLKINYGWLFEYRSLDSEFYDCNVEHAWCRSVTRYEIDAQSYSFSVPVYLSFGNDKFFWNFGTSFNFLEFGFGEKIGRSFESGYGAPIDYVYPSSRIYEKYSNTLVKRAEFSFITGFGLGFFKRIIFEINGGYSFISGPELAEVGNRGVLVNVGLSFVLRHLEKDVISN